MHLRMIYCCFSTVLLSACASLPDNQRHPSYSLTNTQDTNIAQGIAIKRSQGNGEGQACGMLLLNNGLDAFLARVALARAAEKTLDVQYYLFHNDLSGSLLVYELWQAAERGVRVRLLVDDMDMAGKDKNLVMLNAHANFEVRLFNPFIRGKTRAGQLLTRFGSVTRRMHNKSFTADNQISIIGGRNVGDEYFGASEDVAFGDLDVALTGPVVQEVSTSFDLYWNSELSYPADVLVKKNVTQADLLEASQRLDEFVAAQQDSNYAQALRRSDLVEQVATGNVNWHWGEAEAIYDDPMKISSSREQTQYHMAPELGEIINGVSDELIVVSPYFVPGKEGVTFFSDMIQRGVKVRILTNSLSSNDVSIVHSGYSKYRRKLLDAGVELYEMDDMSTLSKKQKKALYKARIGASKSSLHAKYFILDREQAFIGSLNLDPRSVVENTEIGAIIGSNTLAQSLASDFDEHINDIAYQVVIEEDKVIWKKTIEGEDRVWHKEPNTSWWMRFKVGFMRLLPAESQI